MAPTNWTGYRPKDPKPCAADGCAQPARALGLCRAHYETVWRERRQDGADGPTRLVGLAAAKARATLVATRDWPVACPRCHRAIAVDDRWRVVGEPGDPDGWVVMHTLKCGPGRPKKPPEPPKPPRERKHPPRIRRAPDAPPIWGGTMAARARAILADIVDWPTDCARCGQPVNRADRWRIEHREDWREHPKLMDDVENWQVRHIRCPGASDPAVRPRYSVTSGFATAGQPLAQPLPAMGEGARLPPCVTHPQRHMWTQDPTWCMSAATAAAEICLTACPTATFATCQRMAEQLHPVAGVWAGRLWVPSGDGGDAACVGRVGHRW